MGSLEEVRSKYNELFKETPIIIRSPGRVNLIGEHTDYNNGFVLPAAIDKAIYFAIAPRDDGNCEIFALDMNDSFRFAVNNLCSSDKGWPNYLMGVIDQLARAGHMIKGFNCVFGGDIPIGAGMSSSAAIEAGLAFALNEIFFLGIDKLSLVKLAQKAENEFVGVRCGIMDQFINIHGKANRVLKLDCKTLEYEYYPFENDDLRIVLCNTMVHHSLASSEYNTRRAQCEDGVKILQKYNKTITSLRDVTLNILNKYKNEFDEIIFTRCKYIIEENRRLLNACTDLQKGDFKSFGEKMYGSHTGLRDEYEVSCNELDLLVEIASLHKGVLGARMMGGGFGGCTINLVKRDFIDDFKTRIIEQYKNQTKKESKIYVCKIKEGTEVIN
ncbi:MAG: galactokinase [Ignavibacteria bacterium RBG_13_36_8]|nr:MAG: galactokinase [Ignavibacteria bacterium RBG_13_36_8]